MSSPTAVVASPTPAAPGPLSFDEASAAALADFRTLPELIAEHARARPDSAALVTGDDTLSYAQLDALIDRVAATLQRDGARRGDTIAICAFASNAYVAVFMGALRAGLAVAPLAPSSTPAQIAGMAQDAGAGQLFLDAPNAALVSADLTGATLRRIRLDDSADATGAAGGPAAPADLRLADWLAPAGARPQPVALAPALPFNIIYSSGTTGTPKGIVQSHGMRWGQVRRAEAAGYGPGSVTLIATPLYSNTTLVVVIPTLARGGTLVLLPKFDTRAYLELAQRHRASHTMLVPVQYQRLMDYADFGRYDLSSFQFKACTSAPFRADLKAQVLARWPGGLTEYYGMTEGGGSCILYCHLHPDKLHTVGQPAEGHDMRLIDEDGVELPRQAEGAEPVLGEIVGRSVSMMLGYHKQPAKSREAEWFDAAGNRFIRTGDVGRFDADGFLILMDRRKDMVISGGFNIYPSDLEAELRQHPAVADAAVVGVPSREWGETPVAFVVRKAAAADDAESIRQWMNARVGKTQRLHALRLIDELPRSAIGKVLKRELRDAYRE
ncbi:class I adenylate-forming enzyme family protein [Aquabacterium sp. OR-4]|uniref:class I adenylate-forming enzyme family protein n=1 Tax=Aquabacterium sp. OR-4 TaxID=2978127 RepID=UPI0021B3AD7B|nr:class I adenylate-forming enzyme family protein [Aquabacterium sp. OR-4]MDT7835690.1 class I adenylate-forming enzyme family protein [Aquabacterium sp. OR-4]